MLKWLKSFFVSKNETPPTEAETQPNGQQNRKGKSHSRSHSKRVRERERDLRRNWTGQKGSWKKFDKNGVVVATC
jgi:hypothetical protein